MTQEARTCPNGHPVGNDADRFCDVCGASLTCSNGHPITNPSDRFCEICGAPRSETGSPPSPARTKGDLPFPWPVLAGVGVIAVIIVAVMAFFVLPSGDGDSDSSSGTPVPGETPTPSDAVDDSACLRLFVNVDFSGVEPQDTEVTQSPVRGAGCADGEYHEGDSVTLVAEALPGMHPVWGSTPEVLPGAFELAVTFNMPAENLFVSVIYYEGDATAAAGTPSPSPAAASSPSPAATTTLSAPTATSAPAPTATKAPPPPTATKAPPPPTATATKPAPTATQQVSGACWGLFINASFYPDVDPEPVYTISRTPQASEGCPAGQYRAGEAITLSASPVPGYHPVWGTSPDNLIPAGERHQATVVLTMAGQDVFAGPVYFED